MKTIMDSLLPSLSGIRQDLTKGTIHVGESIRIKKRLTPFYTSSLLVRQVYLYVRHTTIIIEFSLNEMIIAFLLKLKLFFI